MEKAFANSRSTNISWRIPVTGRYRKRIRELVMDKLKIIWTNQAKSALKSIYDYYKEKSLQGANNVKSDLLQSPK